MTDTRIRPAILGSGGAGAALRHAFALYPEAVAPARWLARDEPLPPPADPGRDLLVLANPHALHAPRLLEAAERGYRFCVCEKPAAVDLEQVEALTGLPVETWICHGYRMLWGPGRLRQAWADGRFGRVVSIEGRYWQSSAARSRGAAASSWKDDPALGGRFDALLDLASHWADLVSYIAGAESSNPPTRVAVRRWYANAASPHRDTHVHLAMEVGGVATFGSISKTVHGAGNELAVTIVGEAASASWSFSDPDRVVWGEGDRLTVEARSARELPARPSPFHGLGWIEGYARLAGEVVARIEGGRATEVAGLEGHLALVRALLVAAAAEG